jgi:DNA-binding response OmpR family regulator
MSALSSGGVRAALVVEDNMIIALEIEAHLEDLGVRHCLIASTVESGLAILEVRDIAFAILDVNLGLETSEEVAIALQVRGVPFIFLTGYGELSSIARRFAGAPVLVKPIAAASLRQALKKIDVS